MPKKEVISFHGSVRKQDVFVSSSLGFTKEANHVSINISGKVKNGRFSENNYELQISRETDFDISVNFAGALICIKPVLSFVVTTSAETFSYLVPMVSSKALKEVYISFEKPHYGKARVISWSVSTNMEL